MVAGLAGLPHDDFCTGGPLSGIHQGMPEPSSKPQRRPWRRLVLIPLGALAGVGAGYWIGKSIPKGGRTLTDLGWAFPILVVGAAFLAIAFHELGHVVGGWLAGYRFHLYIVGPLRVSQKGDRVRIGWNRSWALAGGLASMTPPREGSQPRDMLCMVAGGPAASWLLAAAAFGAAVLLTAAPVKAAMFVIGLFSLGIGVVTLLPMHSGGFNTDGARILLLARGGPAADRWCAVSSLGAAQLSGVRPRDWDPQLLQRATHPADGSFDYIGAALMAYAAALDRGDVAEAGRWVDGALNAIERWPAPFRSFAYVEAAYFEGRHRGRAAEARAWLQHVKPGAPGFEKFALLRAQSAVLLAEGDRDGAARAAREGLAEVDRRMHLTGAAGERELLEDLLAAALQ